MNHFYKTSKILFLLAIIAGITAGCASKRYAKKAAEFEEAGLYKDAANYYYESVKRKDTRVEAKLGLRKNGQLVLEEKLSDFTEAYKKGENKQAVYKYLEAEKYYNKVKAVGVELSFPEHHKAYYQEVKDEYANKRYAEGVEKLNRKEYAAAEQVFQEIMNISPNYKDVKQKFTTAKYEPIYQQANDDLDAGKYRTAYYTFERILNETGSYRNARILKDQAQEEATLTLLVPNMTLRRTGDRNQGEVIIQKIKNELNERNDPFLKIIEPTSLTIDYYDNRTRRYNFEALNLTGVDAILTTDLSRVITSEGRTSALPKRGYLKKVTKYTDENGEEKEKISYQKTTYVEYTKENKAQLHLAYKLLNTSDGTVWLSDVVQKNLRDNVHYARFKGDNNKLIPGYWKSRTKDSPEDVVQDNSSKRDALKKLLNARSDIKPPDALQKQAIEEVTATIVEDIITFNPEQ
ncbi:MAG: hypothetical protein ACQESW_00585 [Bacteroidota bacterium]